MEIDVILALHLKWSENDPDGIRANLQGAYLWGVRGDGTHIKNIATPRYLVAYTATDLSIGCQQHPISKWWAFDEGDIARMGGPAAGVYSW